MGMWRSLTTISLVMTVCCTVGSAVAGPAPPSIALQEEVIETFLNGAGEPVFLRRGYHVGGGTGFGYEKITKKHGIRNTAVVGAVVRSPQVVREEGNYWVHEKQALLIKLFGEPESVTVRVVINYGSWAGPGQHGVVTAYCDGYNPECPDWVNTAFAVD